MRLWDTLLADPAGRADCLLRLCIAMLVHVREELLAVRHLSCHLLFWYVHRHCLPIGRSRQATYGTAILEGNQHEVD